MICYTMGRGCVSNRFGSFVLSAYDLLFPHLLRPTCVEVKQATEPGHTGARVSSLLGLPQFAQCKNSLIDMEDVLDPP